MLRCFTAAVLNLFWLSGQFAHAAFQVQYGAGQTANPEDLVAIIDAGSTGSRLRTHPFLGGRIGHFTGDKNRLFEFYHSETYPNDIFQ